MSAEATAAPVEGPRPFTITHDDHRGVVVSVAILFILYACMIIGMRLAARVRTMGVDDWLAVAATIFSVIQFAIVIGAVPHMLGTSFDHYNGGDATTVAKLLRASEVFLFISLFIVKCAVIWLCRRLFTVNQKAPKIVCDAVLVLAALWCLASILIVTVGCDEQAAIGLEPGKCSGLMKRWVVVGVLDGVTELFIFSLSIIVVWPLRMTMSRRISAVSCFLCRLPIILFIGLHLYYLSDFIDDPNKGVAVTKPVILRQAELLFSLFSAAIPALNLYLRKFQTISAPTFGYSPGTYGGHSYGLKSITTKSRGYASAHDKTEIKDSFTSTSYRGNYQVTVDLGKSKGERIDDGQESLVSHNSEEMIIRKDVIYEISYADGEGQAGPAGQGAANKHASRKYDK